MCKSKAADIICSIRNMERRGLDYIKISLYSHSTLLICPAAQKATNPLDTSNIKGICITLSVRLSEADNTQLAIRTR